MPTKLIMSLIKRLNITTSHFEAHKKSVAYAADFLAWEAQITLLEKDEFSFALG